MGCLNEKQIKKLNSTQQQQYMKDIQLGDGLIRPLYTTLFNLLRKPNQLQIIQLDGHTSKLFSKQTTPNFSVLSPKDIKMLYSFKNILLIGNNQGIINQIRSNSNPKNTYVIDNDFAKKFLNHYPIFRAGQPVYQPKYLPIFAFNSGQIEKKGPRREIFLHSQSNKNQGIYSALQINQIVGDNILLVNQQVAQYLNSANNQRILFLHAQQRKQDDILSILTFFAVTEYGMNSLSAKIYLRKYLPQTSINEQIIIANSVSPRPSLQTKANQQLTLTQTFQKYLKQLYTQMGGGPQAKLKLQRSYNLLVTLTSNIYNNKNSENYRQIRKTNSQIYELLGKYKNGKKLLSSVGFLEESSGYVNKTDAKYLKIYRTDLDMAYRNLVTHIQNSNS